MYEKSISMVKNYLLCRVKEDLKLFGSGTNPMRSKES